MGAHILGIKLLDHIVLGDTSYFSFADQGLIEDYEKESEVKFKGGEK